MNEYHLIYCLFVFVLFVFSLFYNHNYYYHDLLVLFVCLFLHTLCPATCLYPPHLLYVVFIGISILRTSASSLSMIDTVVCH